MDWSWMFYVCFFTHLHIINFQNCEKIIQKQQWLYLTIIHQMCVLFCFVFLFITANMMTSRARATKFPVMEQWGMFLAYFFFNSYKFSVKDLIYSIMLNWTLYVLQLMNFLFQLNLWGSAEKFSDWSIPQNLTKWQNNR